MTLNSECRWLAAFCIVVLLSLCTSAGQSHAADPESRIQWQIINRFSPFEIFGPDAPEVFRRYRFAEGETGKGWYARLTEEAGEEGLSSPFAQVTPWNTDDQYYDIRLLRYLQKEDADDTLVQIILWADQASPCRWMLGQNEVQVDDCSKPVRAWIPLHGQEVRLTLGDSETREMLTPQHLVIVAFGDEYSSGEGNPDQPTRWKPGLKPAPGDLSWLIGEDTFADSARWIDDACHRSFFSYPSLVALQAASRDPHRFVSFLNYACTGAAIFDGLLYPQDSPAGRRDINSYSQINRAVEALCSAPPAETLLAIPGWDGVSIGKLHRTKKFNPLTTPLMECREKLRKPDYVLVSVGNNDTGQPDILRYFLLPDGLDMETEAIRNALPDVCPSPENQKETPAFQALCAQRLDYPGYNAPILLEELPARVDIMAKVIAHYLGVLPGRVIMPQYPEFGHPGPAQPDNKVNLDAWSGLSVELLGRLPSALHPAASSFALSSSGGDNSEQKQLQREGILFRDRLAEAAEQAGLSFLPATRNAFLGHGWWLGTGHDLTNLPPEWSPASWLAYRFEPEGRAVRTANDSYLIQSDLHHRPDGGMGAGRPNLLGQVLLTEIVAKAIPEAN